MTIVPAFYLLASKGTLLLHCRASIIDSGLIFSKLKEELDIRYRGIVDENEIERQIREARQKPEQSYSDCYDYLCSLARKLHLSEDLTERTAIKQFKISLKYQGLRGYLARKKPRGITSAHQYIGE